MPLTLNPAVLQELMNAIKSLEVSVVPARKFIVLSAGNVGKMERRLFNAVIVMFPEDTKLIASN